MVLDGPPHRRRNSSSGCLRAYQRTAACDPGIGADLEAAPDGRCLSVTSAAADRVEFWAALRTVESGAQAQHGADEILAEHTIQSFMRLCRGRHAPRC